ncbi:MAG: hypothetical protein WCK82_04975 [Bacteroidota bacterium]
MKKFVFLSVFCFCSWYVQAQSIKILFDATKAETAANADWVIDEDLNNLSWNPGASIGGSEGNAQRIPTPAQSGITASTPQSYWKGGLSAWGIDCVKKGYTVESLPYNGAITYGNASNPQDLSNYKVFILCEPNIIYTAAEKTAIMNFVQNGGGLFMVADHTISDRNNDSYDSPEILNDLMGNNSIQNNPFGMTFNLANISVTSNNIRNLPNDSILNGPMGNVTQVKWSNGTTMTINPSANTTVKGVVYNTGSSFGNNNVMVAYARYGKGKVAAIGDSSPCDDGSGDTGDALYDGWLGDAAGNHEKLIMNATIWLAIKDSVSPTVIAPKYKDLKLDAILKPQTLVNGFDTVAIRIKNTGTRKIDTVTVAYRLNNNTAVNIFLTGLNIDTNSVYTYTFASPLNINGLGSYKLCTWVKATGDTIPINDTLCNNYSIQSPAVGISTASISNTLVSTNNPNTIIGSIQLVDSLEIATLNSLSLTTAGTYTPADIQSNGFKIWINNANTLSGATQLGASQAVVNAGGTISVSGVSQTLSIGTWYILLTADIAFSATTGNTIGLAGVPFSKFTFSGTTNLIGSNPTSAGSLVTISETGPVKMQFRSNLSYTENFTDIANWANGFTAGVGAGRWAGVLAGAGTIPNAKVITTASTTFQTSSSASGVQRGSLTGNVAGTIVLLSTNSTNNTTACAIDLLLDYTNRNADSLFFDASTVSNSTGNRAEVLKVFASIDSVNFTELTGTNLPYTATNNVAGSANIRLKLPSFFNNISTCRLRFYCYNGVGGTTGSRPKISLDNVQVTAVCPQGTSVLNVTSCSAYTWNGVNYGNSGLYSKTLFGAAKWGCDSIVTLNLIISPLAYNALEDTMRVCGSSYTLNAGSGYTSYLWNTGSTSQIINPSQAGWYKVTVSNGSCSAKDSVLLSMVNVGINNPDTNILAGSVISLNPSSTGLISSPLTYIWSNGNNTKNNTISPTKTTNYYCTVSNGINSCVDSVTVYVDVKIRLKMYFEGYYDNGKLRSLLNNVDGISPLNLCDSVQIFFYDSSTQNVIYSSKQIIDTAGFCQIIIPYYIANTRLSIGVTHRGSIETWTSNPIRLDNAIVYDFTNSQNKALANNLKDNGTGVFLIFTGDINQDGSIDFSDYPSLDMGSKYGDFGYLPTDLNGDASVDFNDYPIIDINSSNGVIAIRP